MVQKSAREVTVGQASRLSPRARPSCNHRTPPSLWHGIGAGQTSRSALSSKRSYAEARPLGFGFLRGRILPVLLATPCHIRGKWHPEAEVARGVA